MISWHKLSQYSFILLIFAGWSCTALAKVYYSKNEAMELAFGNDALIEMLPLFPDDAQHRTIEQQAKVKLDSALFTFYVGKKQGQIIGYAAIETQLVRTKPETLLVVLDAQGKLKNVLTLAFHEPPEYEPPAKWYALLHQRPIEELATNGAIQGISGATLSTRAALNSARKVISIYQQMIQQPAKQ